MKLLLKRKFKGPEYTIGDLFIDGKFFCNTLEDTVRILPLLCPDTPQGIKCRCNLIHSGNDASHTEGCILVGKNTVKGKVLESRATSDRLNEILSREKEITIDIE